MRQPDGADGNGGVRPSRGGLLRDVVRGAVLGDFAPALGLAGAATQVVLGYLPVVGPLAALRDAAAAWRRRDRPGCALNLLALVPVIGGVAKTIEVLRDVRRIGRAVVVQRRARPADQGAAAWHSARGAAGHPPPRGQQPPGG